MGESTRSDETEWFILQTLQTAKALWYLVSTVWHTDYTNTSSGIVQNSTGYIY